MVAESVRKLAEESGHAAESVRGLTGALQDGAKDTKAASEETAGGTGQREPLQLRAASERLSFPRKRGWKPGV